MCVVVMFMMTGILAAMPTVRAEEENTIIINGNILNVSAEDWFYDKIQSLMMMAMVLVIMLLYQMEATDMMHLIHILHKKRLVSIFIVFLLLIPLSGCMFTQHTEYEKHIWTDKQMEIPVYEGIVDLDGDWYNFTDMRFIRTKLDEKHKVNVAVKRYKNLSIDEEWHIIYGQGILFIVVNTEWFNDCTCNGSFTIYSNVVEGTPTAVGLDLWWYVDGAAIEYPGLAGTPFVMYWNGKSWSEKRYIKEYILEDALPWMDYSQLRAEDKDMDKGFGFVLRIPIDKNETENLKYSKSLAIELIDDDHKKLWSWGDPNDFSTYTPLVFYNHSLWYEQTYNGTIVPYAKKAYFHNFSVYSDIKNLKINLSYNQSIGIEDLNLKLYDGNQTLIAESNKSAGKEEEIILTNFTDCAFGTWSIEVVPKTKIVISEIDYWGKIRIDY